MYIYMEYIRNIYDIKIIRNTIAAFGGAPMGRLPSAAAPLGLCSLFLLIDFLCYENLWILLIYAINIS